MKIKVIFFLAACLVSNSAAQAIPKSVALRSTLSERYVRAGVTDKTLLAATSDRIAGWETFEVIELGGNKIALRSALNKKYIRAGVSQQSFLAATSDHIAGWEIFKIINIEKIKESKEPLTLSHTDRQYILRDIRDTVLYICKEPELKNTYWKVETDAEGNAKLFLKALFNIELEGNFTREEWEGVEDHLAESINYRECAREITKTLSEKLIPSQ